MYDRVPWNRRKPEMGDGIDVWRRDADERLVAELALVLYVTYVRWCNWFGIVELTEVYFMLNILLSIY